MNYRFSYESQGDRNNPVILFLHGFMGNSKVFAEAMSLLSAQFYCLAVDLPGHGQTQIFGSDSYYSMETTAVALVELLHELKLDPCCLVGYSMGGRLALYLACFFPQLFPKVVLESSSPGLKTEREREQRRESDGQLAQQLINGNFANFLATWYSKPLFNSLQQHPQFEQLLKSRLNNNPSQLAQSLLYMGTGSQPSLWQKLSQMENHLLLLVGARDDKFTAINSEMAVLCHHAQLEVIQGCGHNIHFEDVNQFVNRIRLFVVC